MYDINRRKQFKTVGELKDLLKNIPDETEIIVCGNSGEAGYFHIDTEGTLICLDYDQLDDAYELEED